MPKLTKVKVKKVKTTNQQVKEDAKSEEIKEEERRREIEREAEEIAGNYLVDCYGLAQEIANFVEGKLEEQAEKIRKLLRDM